MNIYISPRADVQLTSWSFTNSRPKMNTLDTADGRSHYFVFYSHGVRPKEPWKFWLELKVSYGMAQKASVMGLVACADCLQLLINL